MIDKLKNKVFTIGAAYTFCVIWVFLVSLLWKKLGIFPPINYPPSVTFDLIFFGLIFAPIVEEIVFRVPLKIVKKLDPDFMIPMIIISSAVFGWLHGGIIKLPIQGVIGAAIAWVYIRNGYCYWSAVTTHFLWNFSCYFIFR